MGECWKKVAETSDLSMRQPSGGAEEGK